MVKIYDTPPTNSWQGYKLELSQSTSISNEFYARIYNSGDQCDTTRLYWRTGRVWRGEEYGP